MLSSVLPVPKQRRPKVDKPVKKWDSSTLKEEWIHRSGNMVMIRLRVWELTQSDVEAAVSPFFEEKSFQAKKVGFKGLASEYAYVLTTLENLDILRNANFQIGTTILRKVPKHIPPPSVKYNMLTCTIPDWVTAAMLEPYFAKYNSDPNITDRLVTTRIDPNGVKHARVCFSENPNHQDDSLIAIAMQCPTILIDNDKSATCHFKPLMLDAEQYQRDHTEREMKYLEALRKNDPEKYARELRGREQRLGR